MSHILLSLKDIQKTYGSGAQARHALKGITLDIYAGEIIGLLGVNGAGKTTLSSIIASLIPATSGSVQHNGVSIYDDLIAFRKILGFCPQKPNFDKKLTVKENLLFSGRYYGLSGAQCEQRAHELMEQFELTKYADASPFILSGGYKQRLIIARSLMHKPKLLILDEPTVGLDPHIRRQLWDVVSALKKEGVTVVLTTHYLDEAEVLSDRVCILDKGVIRMIDTPVNLKNTFSKGTLEDVFLQLMQDNL